ncbi:recombinase family protein [Niveispirillum sp. BGYR6]|uniref:recombinase family protein n=2 Tax=Niveispirillum TaxID=1543704 RepID=UPI0022B99C88|nr:recombinase family protein [Niveispirillum sp. BGYR6]MDG5497919.1 recombinase family protein [Niveispirillum sp. BGYR6]
MRAAIYARYSSDQQSASSIEDQIRICRERALRQGWKVAGCYKDAATSGASMVGRAGIQALLRDAQSGAIDIVLAEALDRLSRDQADIAILHRQLTFLGIKIVTLADDEINEMHIGLKGTMNALFLKDLAAKTHRGLRGRVEKGKAGGGLCYGYDVIRQFDAHGEPIRGDRRINDAEASVVRRIFREFADGVSPRSIAGKLNAEGVPGPAGNIWGDTTIRGHVVRGTGILNNELYIGMLVWNKLCYRKDPSTGKRVPKLNPESEWIRTGVPELRIIDDELWLAVRRRQEALSIKHETSIAATREAHANRLTSTRRPDTLLSGLLQCGCCGYRYNVVFRGRYGCANHYRRGACGNGHTIKRLEIEARVLDGLRHKLVTPERVTEALEGYMEEADRQNRDLRGRQEQERQALIAVERRVAAILTAIEENPRQKSLIARLEELECQEAELRAKLAAMPIIPALDLPTDIADQYQAMIARLEENLTDPDQCAAAMGTIRSLITGVVLEPGTRPGEVRALLRGALSGLIKATTGRELPLPVVIPSVDAGTGFEPVTFRL